MISVRRSPQLKRIPPYKRKARLEPWREELQGRQANCKSLLRKQRHPSVLEGLAPPATAHLCQLSGWTEAHPYGGRNFHCVHSHAKVGLYLAESATEADSALRASNHFCSSS